MLQLGFPVIEQGRIHGSISRVRVGRGSMVVGQGQKLKSDLLSTLITKKTHSDFGRMDRWTGGRTDGRTDGPT